LVDNPIITDVAFAAFSGDELFAWLYPRYEQYPWTIRRDWLQRLRKRTVEPGAKIFVAELDGEVVGFAVWKRFGDDANATKWMNDTPMKSEQLASKGLVSSAGC
jgi:L-amino acid N-acyltransferase YncA